MTRVDISSDETTVGDLTMDAFRELVREVVVQTLSDLLTDPDEGLALREDFIEEIRHSLAAVEAGGKTIPVEQVAEKLGLTYGGESMDVLAETLDAKLREWQPNTVAEVRERVAEIIDLADHDTLDIMQSRSVEQEVLDLIDDPTTR